MREVCVEGKQGAYILTFHCLVYLNLPMRSPHFCTFVTFAFYLQCKQYAYLEIKLKFVLSILLSIYQPSGLIWEEIIIYFPPSPQNRSSKHHTLNVKFASFEKNSKVKHIKFSKSYSLNRTVTLNYYRLYYCIVTIL